MRRTNKKSARRSWRPRRSGKRQASHDHLFSKVETVITTKTVHKRRELYPLAVGSLFNEASVGADTDIRMIGYTLRLDLATGNNTRTVSAALGHSGPWVRQSAGDGFNQTITTKPFRNNSLVFVKKVLASSEREFLSPHKDQSNQFVLQLDDPCGVIPGCSIKITALIHFIRPHLPTMMMDADSMATDRYSDQDINGAVPTPPSTNNDVPAKIVVAFQDYLPEDTNVTPVVYRATNPAHSTWNFTVTPSPGILNVVGQFVSDSATTDLQKNYAAEGFEGTITFNGPSTRTLSPYRSNN